MSAYQLSTVSRWISSHWPSWPLTLRVNLCYGNSVNVCSIEFIIDVNLTPTAIRVVSSSGYLIGLLEYDSQTDQPQKTKLICNPPIEMTHLDLFIMEPFTSVRNPFDQVLITNLLISYLPITNCLRTEASEPNEEQDNFQSSVNEVEDEFCSELILTDSFKADFGRLERQCKNCINQIRERRKRCQDLELTKESARLDQASENLSSLITQIQACERQKSFPIGFGNQSETDPILECFRELQTQVISEINEIVCFDPTVASEQPDMNVVNIIDRTATKMDPYGDLDQASYKMTLLDTDRKSAANRLYELFGADSIDALFFSLSKSARLQAMHRCFTKIRSHSTDQLFKRASERLIGVVKYDSCSHVRELALVITELALDSSALTGIAVHFLSDSCKPIRNDAARILCNIWQESEHRRTSLWTLLNSINPDADWSVVLGWCYLIHRLILMYDCSELASGTRICISNVMPFITRALQNENQYVRNAAVSLCNEIEAKLGPGSTEHYLSGIDAMSMLTKLDKLSELADVDVNNMTSNEEPKLSSLLSSNPEPLSSDIQHFIPVAKTSEEVLKLWSF